METECNTILIEQLEFSYGKNTIFSQVNLSAQCGQCIAIIGMNGTGKTTLLNVLAGIKKATKGKITIPDGTFIGYVPQVDYLTDELSVWDNLLLWYVEKPKLTEELQKGLLKQFGLWEMRKKKVSQLSGGMRKKASIACALAQNPQILILDEPSASLDLIGKQDIRNNLVQWKSEGKTILISTHEEDEIALCDKIYILKNNNLLELPTTSSKENITQCLREDK